MLAQIEKKKVKLKELLPLKMYTVVLNISIPPNYGSEHTLFSPVIFKHSPYAYLEMGDIMLPCIAQ